MHSTIAVLFATTATVAAQVYGTADASPSVSTSRSQCDTVYDNCLQGYISKGGSPNFADCNAQRAACAGAVPSTTASGVYTTAAPTTTARCDSVYNGCIQSYINGGGSPNFADCNASRASCSGTSYPTTSAPSSSTTSGPCDKVYDTCLQGYINKGSSPNFADCNAQRAQCVGTASTTKAPTPSTTATPCDKVYDTCLQGYINKGSSPNFADCNAQRAACAGTVSQPSTRPATSVTTTGSKPPATTSAPSRTTTTVSVPAYHGAAATQGPVMGLLALGALALL